jgi:hypothetical protein
VTARFRNVEELSALVKRFQQLGLAGKG